MDELREEVEQLRKELNEVKTILAYIGMAKVTGRSSYNQDRAIEAYVDKWKDWFYSEE